MAYCIHSVTIKTSYDVAQSLFLSIYNQELGKYEAVRL